MNDAHLHMVVNHFPIIGTIFGLGILVAGLFLKNNIIKNTAYILFAIAAIFAFASMNTGEGAEEIVEDFPNIGKQIIHEHEELAEKFAIVMYVLGIASLLGLYLNLKNNAKAKLMSFLVLTVAIVGVILSKAVGTSGGEIRHTEIRENSVESAVNKIENKELETKDTD
ncbi:hypothetical protein [Flavobacterium sp.]|uniref:hypothetical protein n=1 Tax=Flavobacterium sp. TaxID=239 RepID=UPI0037539553